MGRSVPVPLLVRLAIGSDPGFIVWESNHDLSHAVLSWSADGALTDDGQQLTLTPAEFAARFGWQNDPSKVTLTPAE
jgi:hypothetical protein